MSNEWEPSEEDVRNNYLEYCNKFIDVNKECYVAQWVLQNPDKNIEDYVLCHQTSVNNSRMWMERDKEGKTMETDKVIYKRIDVSSGGSLIGELDTKTLLDVCKDWSVLKDNYLCDCDKAWNFGKLCKYPEKYKDGVCK